MNNDQAKAYIFGTIFTLANKLQILGDKFDSNLTVKQWLLLAGIHNSGNNAPTISSIAKIIGNSRQNVKKMILILENKGFVTIESDSKDARVQQIRLTKKCYDYFAKREERELDFLKQLFDGFHTTDIKNLANGIKKLENNIVTMGRANNNEEG